MSQAQIQMYKKPDESKYIQQTKELLGENYIASLNRQINQDVEGLKEGQIVIMEQLANLIEENRAAHDTTVGAVKDVEMTLENKLTDEFTNNTNNIKKGFKDIGNQIQNAQSGYSSTCITAFQSQWNAPILYCLLAFILFFCRIIALVINHIFSLEKIY